MYVIDCFYLILDQYSGQYYIAFFHTITSAFDTYTGQWRMTFMEQKLKCDVYIGKNLRRLREKFGLSQEKLCAELQCRNCDIGRSTYAKYENGELNIRVSVLMALKKIYNCSYDEFFDDLDSH